MGGIIVVDFIDMNEAENRQKLYERMCANMQKDRARHNILPLSKFGLMQITRQRVRPAMDVNTTEICPTCFGKGTIKSSILFTDTLESKIDYLVNKLKVKKFSLHVHPYVAAFINQGLVSLRRKWQMKYGFGIKIIPSQKLAFLQYVFYDTHGEEIDMKEEIEIKSQKRRPIQYESPFCIKEDVRGKKGDILQQEIGKRKEYFRKHHLSNYSPM